VIVGGQSALGGWWVRLATAAPLPAARLPPAATRSQPRDWTCDGRARSVRMHTRRTRRGRGQQTRRYPWRGGAAEQTFRATGAWRLQLRQAECFFKKAMAHPSSRTKMCSARLYSAVRAYLCLDRVSGNAIATAGNPHAYRRATRAPRPPSNDSVAAAAPHQAHPGG
jgi:hypothetical protein